MNEVIKASLQGGKEIVEALRPGQSRTFSLEIGK